MESITDYAKLWREIVEARAVLPSNPQEGTCSDYWETRSHRFSLRVNKRWKEPDSTREFVKTELKSHPDSTLLDIGCGPGNWAVWLSEYAQSITALDVSSAMLDTLRKNADEANIGHEKLRIIQGSWPETEVEPHDYVLAAHSCYGARDLPAFIEKMSQTARKKCFMLIRASLQGNFYETIARRVWGQPYDSPSFALAYNVMLQMGMRPDAIFEEGGIPQPKRYSSFDELLQDVKAHFGLSETTYDDFIAGLVREHMQEEDGELIMQRQSCPVLIHWKI